MIIRMEHPKHGRMHVYDLQEKQRAELSGWTEVVKQSGKPHLELIKQTIPESFPDMKRKLGRPRKQG